MTFSFADLRASGMLSMEFYHNASGKADGPLQEDDTFDSGQYMHVAYIAGAGDATPTYEDGQIVDPNTTVTGSGSAGYIQIESEDTPVCVAVRWTFSGAYSTGTGSVAFGVFDKPVYDPQIVSPAHMSIGTHGWNLGVFTPGAGPSDPSVFTVLADGIFDPPLVADGETTYSAAVVIDKANEACYLLLPDHTVTRVENAAFAQDAQWPFWEPYRLVSGDQKVGIRWMGGSSVDQSSIEYAEGLYNSKNGKAVTIYGEAASSQEYLVAGTTFPPPPIKTGGIHVGPINIGPSGKAEVDVEAFGFINAQTNGQDPVYLIHVIATDSDSNTHSKDGLITYLFTKQGVISKKFVFSGLPEGPCTFEARHWQYSAGGNGGNNFLQVWNVLGQFFIMSAEAVD